jgi:DNA-directed RNA polymerase subunit RPC12/RpoP
MKQFTKTKENFVCLNCKTKVIGNGFTNHCPKCLYSQHVDINPGDRAETCQGLMKPINFDFKAGKYIVIQKCLTCGAIKRNKLLDGDNIEVLTQLSESIAKKTFF